MAEHVGERLHRDNAVPFASRGENDASLEESPVPVGVSRVSHLATLPERPELALREVVVRQKVELVAVERRGRASHVPRPAGLRVDFQPVCMRPIAHRRVEVVLYHPPAAARLDAALVADGVDRS